MRRRWTLVLAAAALLAAAIPALALAHPKIVRTEPAEDAQLAAPPTVIRITFNEPIEAAFAELRLFDTQARQVDDGSGTRSATDPAALELTPPTLPGGLYTIVWQVVGSDGHRVTGHYSFTVLQQPGDVAPTEQAGALTPTPALPEATPAAPPAPTADAGGPPLWLFALLRALMLAGACGVLGGWVALRVVARPSLPTGSAAAHAAVERGWHVIARASAAAILLGALGYAIAQAWGGAGQISIPALRLVLLETRLGQALLMRALLACAALLLGVWAPGRLAAWPGAAIGVATLATFALSGHAAAEPSPALPVATDILHLLASAAWVGGLAMLAAALGRGVGALEPAQRPQAIAALVTRFSTLALGCVALLTASGAALALARIPAPADLWVSDYGRALLAKLALFGGMLLLGAYHLLLMRPRFTVWAAQVAEQPIAMRWLGRLRQSLRAEIGLAALVLACAGALTSMAPPEPGDEPIDGIPVAPATPPPADTPRPTRAPTPTRVPSVIYDQSAAVDDLRVTLRVDPASLGENTIQVRVQNAEGAPVEVQRVVLLLTMTEMDMGETEVTLTPEGAGVYRIPDQWLSMVGDWRVRVKIRRADADDGEVEFMVPVGG